MALSPKEVKVLTLAALGYCDKEIGNKLNISYGTVRNHMDRIVLKLNARNRTYKLNNKNWLEEYYETYSNSLDSRDLLSV